MEEGQQDRCTAMSLKRFCARGPTRNIQLQYVAMEELFFCNSQKFLRNVIRIIRPRPSTCIIQKRGGFFSRVFSLKRETLGPST